MFEKMNVNFVVELKFDINLETLSPKKFVENILFDKLKVQNIIVGTDFRFGHKRSGDFECLKLGLQYKIDVFHRSQNFIIKLFLQLGLEKP